MASSICTTCAPIRSLVGDFPGMLALCVRGFSFSPLPAVKQHHEEERRRRRRHLEEGGAHPVDEEEGGGHPREVAGEAEEAPVAAAEEEEEGTRHVTFSVEVSSTYSAEGFRLSHMRLAVDVIVDEQEAGTTYGTSPDPSSMLATVPMEDDVHTYRVSVRIDAAALRGAASPAAHSMLRVSMVPASWLASVLRMRGPILLLPLAPPAPPRAGARRTAAASRRL